MITYKYNHNPQILSEIKYDHERKLYNHERKLQF